jgi:hypothetical protein
MGVAELFQLQMRIQLPLLLTNNIHRYLQHIRTRSFYTLLYVGGTYARLVYTQYKYIFYTIPRDLKKSQRYVITPGIEPGTTDLQFRVSTNSALGQPRRQQPIATIVTIAMLLGYCDDCITIQHNCFTAISAATTADNSNSTTTT